MKNNKTPLAEQLRPQCMAEIIGQQSLIGKEGSIRQMLKDGYLRSMILWGPPGTGKTTMARVFAKELGYDLLSFSGSRANIKEIREAVDDWIKRHHHSSVSQGNSLEDSLFSHPSHREGKKDLLVFVDEIHRYNKSQQDYFLPWVEQGLFTLIGATTESPGFEINNALLSRITVMELKPLSSNELLLVLKRALQHLQYPEVPKVFTPQALEEVLLQADGDARRLLNDLETLLMDQSLQRILPLDHTQLHMRLGKQQRRFDKRGDIFYDQISALHKSVRGSDPDASLYWFIRMIDGGCDPLYIARRMIRMASEDIGLSDPQALIIANNAAITYERLGYPEGILALVQALLYLATLPKSNAVYTAFEQARRFVREHDSAAVPLHLRNAPTKIHREMDAGKNYRYAHDEEHAYAARENYWPDLMNPQQWYHPTDRGLEKHIAQRLQFLRSLTQNKG